MIVFVINKHGEVLMPCSNRKARLLLKEKKAKIVNYKPFTIQLLYGSTGYKQETRLGIDTGAKHIGIAITTGDKVLAKGQIELRQNVKKLLTTRKILRRVRRFRKTRYRACRFLNRRRKQDWLPPSIQSRINNTIMWITKFYNLLPNCKLFIEVGNFDIQQIENPDIEGKDYQQGSMYGYRNRIAYLLAREKGICQYCEKEYKKNDPWRLHHIWGKEKDRSQDWALLHESCHIKLHHDHAEFILRTQKSKSYKESAFMNIIRKKLFQIFTKAKFTYGNITFQDRLDLGLEKTHYNDAIAISGIKTIKENEDSIFFINQFRKKKQSLHEVTARKWQKNRNIESLRRNKNTKYSHGFFKNDTVKINNKTGFISGFSAGGCIILDIFGNYVRLLDKSGKQISFSKVETVCHNNTWGFTYDLLENEFLQNVS